MSTKKRRQTMAKRDRERAVELKRTLKREKKQEAAAARRAGLLPDPDSPVGHELEARDDEERLDDAGQS